MVIDVSRDRETKRETEKTKEWRKETGPEKKLSPIFKNRFCTSICLGHFLWFCILCWADGDWSSRRPAMQRQNRRHSIDNTVGWSRWLRLVRIEQDQSVGPCHGVSKLALCQVFHSQTQTRPWDLQVEVVEKVWGEGDMHAHFERMNTYPKGGVGGGQCSVSMYPRDQWWAHSDNKANNILAPPSVMNIDWWWWAVLVVLVL